MDKEEFIKNATQILQDCGLSESQSEAIANLTIISEKNKIKQLIDDTI